MSLYVLAAVLYFIEVGVQIPEDSVLELSLKETSTGLIGRYADTYYVYNFGQKTQTYFFRFRSSSYEHPVKLGFVKVKYPDRSFEKIECLMRIIK